MRKWNYLRFNKHGEPHRDNAYPKEGAFVFGFCGEDHKVMLCYMSSYGLNFVDPYRGLDDDTYIIAWAEIEPPTMPDFVRLKLCKTLIPPAESLESQKRRLSYWKRHYRKIGDPKTKVEAKRRKKNIKYFEGVIDELKKDFVLDNGYHMPPLAKRVRTRPLMAIPTSTN